MTKVSGLGGRVGTKVSCLGGRVSIKVSGLGGRDLGGRDPPQTSTCLFPPGTVSLLTSSSPYGLQGKREVAWPIAYYPAGVALDDPSHASISPHSRSCFSMPF